MADDYKYRSNPSSDPYRRGAEPSRSDFSNSSDPLAELARLIGQDPFAQPERSSARVPQLQPRDLLPRDLPSRDLPSRDVPPRDLSPRDLLSRELAQRDFPPRDPPSRDLPSRDLPQRGYSAPQSTSEWAPSLGSSSDRRYDPEPRGTGRDSYPAFGDYAPPRAAGRDPVLPSDDYLASRGGSERYASPSQYDSYAAPSPALPLSRDEPRWAEANPYAESDRYDEAAGEQDQGHEQGYADQSAHAVAPEHADSEYDDDQYYQDDAPLQPEDEEAYDDAPSAYRRGGIATALALIGCALLGTAGAYAYRSYAHPTAKEPPPVITADQTTPTKMVPAPSAEGKSTKPISERFATAGSSSEQLVSRQEEPVALREPGTASAPRVVLPAPVQPAQAAPVPPPQATASTPPAPAATTTPQGGEPKRVRTVTIRPDGADPSGRPVATTPSAPRTTATTPPAPRATTPPAPRSGGPLSLEPNEPRARTANAPPPRDSLSSHSPSGGFVVQLSSQKTEDEAHSSFRALQSKFPNELGNRQVIIRRADLGAKGVVYRTNIGPFGTAQEAQRFCASYKSAGGQCIVPTN